MSSFPTYALLLQKRCSFLLQKATAAAAYGGFVESKYVTQDHTVAHQTSARAKGKHPVGLLLVTYRATIE